MGKLKKRVDELYNILQECRLCPHECQVDRTEDKIGYCNTGSEIKIASYGPHYGEESLLVGEKGSGTIFFSNCNLKCIYCQNYDISQLGEGSEVTVDKLAKIMVRLQERGCHNINFVTPSHMIHAIVKATLKACKMGLKIPLVYNSGGYDRLEILKLLDGIIDIYMPDIKYANEEKALKYSRVNNYFPIIKKALKEMYYQVGDLEQKNGIATKGLLIRHLVLPDNIDDSKEIIDFIVEEMSPTTYINIMNQYYPTYKAEEYDSLNQRLSRKQYKEVYKYAQKKGLNLL